MKENKVRAGAERNRSRRLKQTSTSTRPTAARANRGASRAASSNKTPPLPPCHRLAPRTRDQAEEFQRFTANLGERLASCVLKHGGVEHLYCRNYEFFKVTERLSVEIRGLDVSDLETILEVHGNLAIFLKGRKAPAFERRLDFDPINDQDAGRWVIWSGVYDQLPQWVWTRLCRTSAWPYKTLAQWNHPTPRGKLPAMIFLDMARLFFRVGEDKPKRVSWEEAQGLIRIHVLPPLFGAIVPDLFGESFGISKRDFNFAADAGDVLSPGGGAK